MRIGDPQNWDKFLDQLDKFGGGDFVFEFSQPPNIVMKTGEGMKVTFINPEFPEESPTDFDNVEGPEDLGILADRLLVDTPEEDFEVLIDDRQ